MIYLRIALMGATLGASVQAGAYLFGMALLAASHAGENIHRIKPAIKKKKKSINTRLAAARQKVSDKGKALNKKLRAERKAQS